MLYDALRDTPWAVLDTKYKVKTSPSTADVAQVVAYAEAKGCRQAFLVYPVALEHPLDTRVGSIRVRTLEYRLDQDLEAEGRRLFTQLLTDAPNPKIS